MHLSVLVFCTNVPPENKIVSVSHNHESRSTGDELDEKIKKAPGHTSAAILVEHENWKQLVWLCPNMKKLKRSACRQHR